MTVYPIQSSFVRGELSPRLHGRVDIDHYSMGLQVARNWIVLRQGGIARRPGTMFIGPVKDETKTSRLLRFEFDAEQAYCIEAGDGYFRFFTLGGRVESGGLPYEVASPYTAADLADLQYTQTGDTIYLAHPNHAPRKLVRSSETSWTLSTVVFDDGPYLDENTTATYMMPAQTGAIHPLMTSNTTPSGVISSTGSPVDAYKAMDGSITSEPAFISGESGNYTFDIGGGTKVADAYWIVASQDEPSRTPTAWQFQGFTGSTWVTLDTREGETGWGAHERRFYDVANLTGYQQYRLAWTSVDGAGNSQVAEMGIHEEGSSQTPFNLTASSTAGINGGSGFLSGDVGRSIRLLGTDGRWRWARIAAWVSSTVVTIRLYGHALPNLARISRWQLGAWSGATGWPRAIGFYEDRLGFACTTTQPQNVWLSKSQDYEDFGTSEPLQDDDGINVAMTGGRLNRIVWIEELGDLAIGTSGAMRAMMQNDVNDPFSALNARQKQQNTYGAAAMQPVICGQRLLYADRYRRRLMEYAYSVQGNGYASIERSIMSDHLFRSGLVDITFQQDPDDLVWSVVGDGRLVSCTFVPDQDVYGFTPHQIAGGEADEFGFVESAVTIPSAEGHVLYMVVRRTINGVTRRYVEYLTMPFEDGDDLRDKCYLDGALTYVGAEADMVTGADHLEGETVGMFVDGIDIGDAVVSGGSVTLPGGAAGEKITIGLRYKSRAETLRVASSGQRDGTGFGRKAHTSGAAIDVLNTAEIRVSSLGRGGRATGRVMFERSLSEVPNAPHALFTESRPITGISDSWNNRGVLVIETDRAYPATIRAIVPQLDGEP